MRFARWAAVVAVFVVCAVLVGLFLSFLGGQADKIDRLSSGYSTLYSQVQSLGGTPEAPAPHDAVKGDQGEPGRDGRDGVNGRNGVDSTVPGPSGSPGGTGPAGPSGAAGPAGPAGPQGEPGPVGADGQNGQPGADGASPFPFSYSDGTTTWICTAVDHDPCLVSGGG